MTPRLIFVALISSTWFQFSAATVAGLGALRVYKWHQQSVGAAQQREKNQKEVNDENQLANSVRIRAEELAQERYRQIFKEFGELPNFDAPAAPAAVGGPQRLRQPAGSTRVVNPFERSAIGK